MALVRWKIIGFPLLKESVNYITFLYSCVKPNPSKTSTFGYINSYELMITKLTV